MNWRTHAEASRWMANLAGDHPSRWLHLRAAAHFDHMADQQEALDACAAKHDAALKAIAEQEAAATAAA